MIFMWAFAMIKMALTGRKFARKKSNLPATHIQNNKYVTSELATQLTTHIPNIVWSKRWMTDSIAEFLKMDVGVPEGMPCADLQTPKVRRNTPCSETTNESIKQVKVQSHQ